MVFTQMNRVIFGEPAAASIVAEADLLGAKRIFLLVSKTPASTTDEIENDQARTRRSLRRAARPYAFAFSAISLR